jgi:hypothetical protein
MLHNRYLQWDILEQKGSGADIDDVAHRDITLSHSIKELRKARKAWYNI